jgi:DNA-binding HxlR family transcriptional regulator
MRRGVVMGKRLPKFFNCPSEFAMEVLGGKWKTVILCFVKEGPCRYSEIRRLAPNLSDKMLTQRLKDLQSAGLITRCKGEGENTTDVYTLTERGESLHQILSALYKWGRQHAEEYGVTIGNPLALWDAVRPRVRVVTSAMTSG